VCVISDAVLTFQSTQEKACSSLRWSNDIPAEMGQLALDQIVLAEGVR
jgi:hypothetical protein